jgi:transposase InsO family protein
LPIPGVEADINTGEGSWERGAKAVAGSGRILIIVGESHRCEKCETGTEVFNTAQGVQFTAEAFTGKLLSAGVAVSRDGRGRALDNVFVERLWRTVKYEDIYIRGYETVAELLQGLIRYFVFYNQERLHQSLGYETPATVYRGIGATGA